MDAKALLHQEGWFGVAALLYELAAEAEAETVDADGGVRLAVLLTQVADAAKRHSEATGE